MAEDVLSIGDISPHPIVMRKCTTCKEDKPEDEYYFKDKAHTKRKERCKKCHIAAVLKFGREHPERVWRNKPENKIKIKKDCRKRYYISTEKSRARALAGYYKNREKYLANKRARYAKNREREIKRTLEWREKNPDKCKAWIEANRPKVRAIVKKHSLLHPETHLNSRAIRKARKISGVVERIKPGMNSRLMAWQNGKCPYCSINLTPDNIHRDHIIPVFRGGAHAEFNFQLTCKPCNLKKHAKHPFDFGAEMGIFTPGILLNI